jgi:KUP system potassium uptake protein
VAEPEQQGSTAVGAQLALAALGVVYGDIGTSPLYALRQCFESSGSLGVSHANVLGVLSLVLWALVLVISVKYLVGIVRADNRGEGGILALFTLLTQRGLSPRLRASALLVALAGASLFFGDGMITPAISVLSAVEGLGEVTHLFDPWIVPIALAILVGLFAVQRRGTGRIGLLFGPVMMVWFSTLGVLGALSLLRTPEVIQAVDPRHAVAFLAANGWVGFATIGSVFLVVTGGEALYADLGHFGRSPIRRGWFAIVLPALALNYLGQGALLLREPASLRHLFYALIPGTLLLPMVLLATAATVIASQAVISGAFSLARQAVQLGFFPRLQVVHTSELRAGQIYLPGVNLVLLVGTVVLVLAFRESGGLASAYGAAVSATMVAETALAFAAARIVFGFSVAAAAAIAVPFLLIDVCFLGANLSKLGAGAWVPLTVGAAVFALMVTWRRGREILRRRLEEEAVPLDLFVRDLAEHKLPRVPGIAVFLTGSPIGIPRTLMHNVAHNKVLHAETVLLTVVTEDVPRIPHSERTQLQSLGDGLFRVIVRYGFSETPDVPAALRSIGPEWPSFEPMRTTYFLGRETLLVVPTDDMAFWRKLLFAYFSRNALDATRFLNLPPNRTIELGVRIEI